MFALKTILISALAVAGVSAAPSPLKERAPVKAACPKTQGEYTENLSCPTLQALGGFLNFQGDNVGATSKNVLEEVNKLLTQQSNPVTNIVQDLTQGTVTGLTNGATFALKAIGATIPELDEKCACNMVFCNSAIIDAQGMCNIGDAAAGTSQACGQALYSCAAFYSADQIASMTGGCCTARNT